MVSFNLVLIQIPISTNTLTRFEAFVSSLSRLSARHPSPTVAMEPTPSPSCEPPSKRLRSARQYSVASTPTRSIRNIVSSTSQPSGGANNKPQPDPPIIGIDIGLNNIVVVVWDIGQIISLCDWKGDPRTHQKRSFRPAVVLYSLEQTNPRCTRERDATSLPKVQRLKNISDSP